MRNAENLVGNTPIVEIPYKDNRLHLKLEGANPGLSIKDRVAFHVCNSLDKKIGLRGRTVVEYSSGNLAIGLAMASKIYGFRLVLIITSKTSPDKVKLLQRYGIELIMVDESVHSESPLGFRGFAEIIAQNTRDSIFIDQFNNPLNPEAHKKTTGPEIHNNVPNADYVFSPMGTGGTASGVAQYFKDEDLPTKVVGVTPDSGVYYTKFHGINESRNVVTAIEGVGEDFIPKNLNLDILANVVEVRDALALMEIENLITETGIYIGGSSGLAVAAAKQFVDDNGLTGKNLVVLCPDSGNRYLTAFSPSKQGNKKSDYTDLVDSYRNGKKLPKIV
ncbi:MAG: cysteine synthase family protein [Candidatus Gracilibacteria bacterium]|jgi:cystathionine beta-synthase